MPPIGTVEERLEALETTVGTTEGNTKGTVEDRLEALEKGSDVTAIDARIDSMADILVKYLTSVGEIYVGATDDLAKLSALHTA